jgi:hypothetical protein
MTAASTGKMLPGTSRGRYGWARPPALVALVGVGVAVFCVKLEVADPDELEEFCSWML